FVSMTFNRHRILRIALQPLSLLGQRLLCISTDQRRIQIKQDAVTNIYGKVLRRAGRSSASKAKITGVIGKIFLRRTTSKGERHENGNSDRAACDGLETAHGPELLKINVPA